jgi:hypothetical protein
LDRPRLGEAGEIDALQDGLVETQVVETRICTGSGRSQASCPK